MPDKVDQKYFYKILLLFSLIVLLWQSYSFSQDSKNTRLFLDVPTDTFITKIDSLKDSLSLPHHFIISGSEKVYRDKFRLIRGVNYRLYEQSGILFFPEKLQPGDSILVIYQKYPLPFVKEYYHRKLTRVTKIDSTGEGKKEITGVAQSRLWEEIDSFSSNLERSGSIVRGVEIGSNRDLTLNSGLNLQISGYITPDVQLVAALTDESTPIQPQGNTQALREVDQVYVKINSPHLGGTLGDFNLTYQNSMFGNLKRKLQGITSYGEFGNYYQQLTYATSRGTFNTNSFLGQEGNQGPYQLVGKNGEREIIVLAGTERVYVNGTAQVRGENNAYIIDYSLGQITFTNNRLITGEDRIEVDFEYANNFQRYGKSLVGLSSFKKKIGQGFEYDLRLFREWDDTKNLLEDSTPLTEEEKEALKAAGNDRTKAAVSGVDSVGMGNGNYLKSDTLLAGEIFIYYRYVGTGNGDFLVRFSSVGKGNGTYRRERLGIYRFVGPSKGEYLPIRLIPLAGDQKLGDFSMAYQFNKYFTINGEGSISDYDRNVFSSIDDENNIGHAYNVGASYINSSTRLFDKSLGALNWQIGWNNREKLFAPLDRQFHPEYSYKWNLGSQDFLQDERTLESVLLYRPIPFIQVSGDVGWIKRGNTENSKRGRGQFTLSDSTIIRGEIYYEIVSSEDSLRKSDWDRYGGDIGKQLSIFYPFFKYKQENRKVNILETTLTGFRFDEWIGGLKLRKLLGLKWGFSAKIRDDYLYNPDQFGERLKLATSSTGQISSSITDSRKWQGLFSFVYREKNYEPYFAQLPLDSIPKYQPDAQFQDTSWIDSRSYLGKIALQFQNESRSIDSRWEYRIASELLALQEKVFVEVGQNNGNYRFDPTLGEYVPDPQGNFLLVIVPTGNFAPITNIKASWQFRFRPKTKEGKYKGIKNILYNISTFTYLEVDEKSTESEIWQLYILNLNKFHNNTSTLQGSYVFNQDLYFFERNPNFGVTLRSRYRDNLSNLYVDAGYNEIRRFWDKSVIYRQRLYKNKLSQEVQYQNNLSYRYVSSIPSRNRDVLSHIFDYKLNYRPVYAWQFQITNETGFQSDRAPLNQLKVLFIEVRPQINYSIRAKARAFANLTYLNVNIVDNPFGNPIPYEMGKGKKEGNSWLWNLRFEYFISTNITTTFNYTGRRDAGLAQTINIMQAEVRAFF